MLYCKKKHLEKAFYQILSNKKKKIKLKATLIQIKATKNKQLYSYKTNKKARKYISLCIIYHPQTIFS